MTIYDEKGAATSRAAGSAAVATSSSTGVTDDDLSCTCHIEGWTPGLRYRDGKVKRGFFFTHEDRGNIGFEGHELIISKPGR